MSPIRDNTPWTSDVPISMPVPPSANLRKRPNIPMQGFIFTMHGLSHDITPEERDEIERSRFIPEVMPNIEWGDRDVS